jgi:hypothetical protein
VRDPRFMYRGYLNIPQRISMVAILAVRRESVRKWRLCILEEPTPQSGQQNLDAPDNEKPLTRPATTFCPSALRPFGSRLCLARAVPM